MVELKNGRLWVKGEAQLLGEDVLVTVTGGDAPHIGSVSMALPRESLTGSGAPSATVSTYNFPGHLDNAVGDAVAKAVCSATGRKTVVTCGIHTDGITADEIAAVRTMTAELIGQLIAGLE